MLLLAGVYGHYDLCALKQCSLYLCVLKQFNGDDLCLLLAIVNMAVRCCAGFMSFENMTFPNLKTFFVNRLVAQVNVVTFELRLAACRVLRLRSSFHQHVLPPLAIAPFLSSPVVSGTDCHLTLCRPRHCLHSRDASRLNCLHEAIPIAPAASDFPFRLLVDAVTHVFSVFRVCKVP